MVFKLPQFSERSRPWIGGATLILMTITLTFMIISISMHNLYEYSLRDTFNIPGRGTMTVDIQFDIGAFQACSDLEFTSDNRVTSSHDCSPFNSDCSLTFDFVSNGEPFRRDFMLPDFSCPTWNAFRAFFIIAIIFTAFGIGTGLMYFREVAGARSVKFFYATIAVMIVALISLVISWGIVAEAVNSIENSFQSSMSKQAAFGLAVTAWVTELLAFFAIIYYHFADPTRKTVST